MRLLGDVVLHAQARERSRVSAPLQTRRAHDRECADLDLVADFRVLNDCAAPDPAVLADYRAAPDLRESLHNRVHPDLHARVDRDRLRLLDGHACQHQFARLALAEQPVHRRQLEPRIDPERLAFVVDLHGLDVVPRAVQNLRHIGQIIFVRGIVGTDLVDVFPEEAGAVTVDPHIGFADGELLRGPGLLLDDLCDAPV
jgi:hypothetical protein